MSKKNIKINEGKNYQKWREAVEKELKRKILINLEGYKINLEHIIKIIENV